jgi:hypothetical protein
LRVQLYQYAIPWGKIAWWRQQVVDHKHCMMAILLVWRFFFTNSGSTLNWNKKKNKALRQSRLTVISRPLTVLEWFAKVNLNESVEFLVKVICNAILKEFSKAGSLLYKENTPKQTQLPPTAHSLLPVLYTSSSVQVCIGFANNRLP